MTRAPWLHAGRLVCLIRVCLMCHFIVLVVRGGSASDIDQVLRRHARQARPIGNVSLGRILGPDEAPFLTTVGHCDCGTVLAHASVDRAVERNRQAAMLTKKGWSQAKIRRWITDREKADERAVHRLHANAPDSLEGWVRIITELLATSGVRQAGLLLHFFSGAIEEEALDLSRETAPLNLFHAGLRDLQEDQLLMAA